MTEGISQEIVLGDYQSMSLVDTEIIDRCRSVGDYYDGYLDLNSFSDASYQRARGGALAKLNITGVGGELAVGKTAISNQWTVNVLQKLTGLDGQQLLEELGNRSPLKGPGNIPLRVFTLSWIDLVRFAMQNRMVKEGALGDWADEDLEVFNSVGKRAIDIASEGTKDFVGARGNYLGYLVIDVAMGTRNRFYPTLTSLLSNPDTVGNLFWAQVLTDRESLVRRLSVRRDLQDVQTRRGMFQWLRSAHVSVNNNDIDYLLEYLPRSFGTLHAAGQVRLQANRDILELCNSGEIELRKSECDLLLDEIRPLTEGATLMDQKIFINQEKRNEVLITRYYPHILRTAGLPREQGFIGLNGDLPLGSPIAGAKIEDGEVRLYPSLIRYHNLVKQISEVNPRLLIV